MLQLLVIPIQNILKEVYIKQLMVGKPGRKYYIQMIHPVVQNWSWILLIQTNCLQICGSTEEHPGALEAEAPEVDYILRMMVAGVGKSLGRKMDCLQVIM